MEKTRLVLQLNPGTYNVTESNIPGRMELRICNLCDGSSVGAISLQASETVTCTFENTEDDDPNKGRIIVIKQTDPDGAR